eukprot:scaffold409494_cov38-Prasinocladus_malaysianus.AAC.1
MRRVKWREDWGRDPKRGSLPEDGSVEDIKAWEPGGSQTADIHAAEDEGKDLLGVQAGRRRVEVVHGLRQGPHEGLHGRLAPREGWIQQAGQAAQQEPGRDALRHQRPGGLGLTREACWAPEYRWVQQEREQLAEVPGQKGRQGALQQGTDGGHHRAALHPSVLTAQPVKRHTYNAQCGQYHCNIMSLFCPSSHPEKSRNQKQGIVTSHK